MQVAVAAMAANLGLLAACPDLERCARALLRGWSALLQLLVELAGTHRRPSRRLQIALSRPDL
jgi:hypothetical protein